MVKCYKILIFIVVVCIFVSVLGGCLHRWNRVDKKLAWEFVEEYEEEILILFNMYQDLEESGSEDYSDIIKYEEKVLMQELSELYFHYSPHAKDLEIWFDRNGDGYDWAVLYTPDPEFDVNSKSHRESYDEMGNGFYIYTFRYGF